MHAFATLLTVAYSTCENFTQDISRFTNDRPTSYQNFLSKYFATLGKQYTLNKSVSDFSQFQLLLVLNNFTGETLLTNYLFLDDINRDICLQGCSLTDVILYVSEGMVFDI